MAKKLQVFYEDDIDDDIENMEENRENDIEMCSVDDMNRCNLYSDDEDIDAPKMDMIN